MPRPKRHMTSIAIHLRDPDLAFFATVAQEYNTTRADVIRALLAAAMSTPEATRKAYEELAPAQVS